nr:sporulation-delaying protein SdpB family protein [Quadrisphaera setariae]
MGAAQPESQPQGWSDRLGRAFLSSRLTDPRNLWFGTGRSLLALAQLSVVLFTSPHALFPPVLGEPQAPDCTTTVKSASFYCIGHLNSGFDWHRWLMAALLLVVASGWRPRLTGILHAWLAYSFSVSISLPDGGESVLRIIAILIIPLCVLDDRKWHWKSGGERQLGPIASGVGFVVLWAVRLQVAFIYLDSAVSKFGVADWVNGTAEYYIVRDPMFGVAGPTSSLMLALTDHPVGVLTLTWGALIIEIVIAALLLLPHAGKNAALLLDVLLHLMIISTMGLWSFSLIMIGSAVIAASPLGRLRIGGLRQVTDPKNSMESRVLHLTQEAPQPITIA